MVNIMYKKLSAEDISEKLRSRPLIALCKSKKSFVYRYKSPETGAFSLAILSTYSYSQEINQRKIDHIIGLYNNYRWLLQRQLWSS